MASFTPHPTSWYADAGWIEALDQQATPFKHSINGRPRERSTSMDHPIVGIESHIEASQLRDFCAELEAASTPLVVCDLPPGLHGTWGPSWQVQARHTRWLEADENGTFPTRPKHRTKQARKGEERGLRIETNQSLDVLLALHQNARERKSIASDSGKLRKLLVLGTDICTPEHLCRQGPNGHRNRQCYLLARRRTDHLRLWRAATFSAFGIGNRYAHRTGHHRCRRLRQQNL